MKKLFTLCILIPLFSFSQKQGNIWYFGNHAGLDFNSGVPVSLTNGATYNDDYPHSEGTSVICDSSGSLMFYSNGQKIWTKNHQIMPNGDSLLGHLSSTQSSLIVPQPNNENLFYVFTTDAFYNDCLKYGFRYSIVDICSNNNLGDVLNKQKNILLLDTVAEKLTAIRHSNGIDYWIITHKFYSNAFYAYLLTDLGIVDTVITHIGSYHKEYCNGSTYPTRSALGQLKASPNGNKIVCVNGQTCYTISELFDFDKTTGVISNVINLNTDSIASLYGVSFSPDNSKLYISSSGNYNRIFQYDLSSSDPNAIINSKTIIASQTFGPWYLAMQLGPDGKIYIAVRNQTSISVINSPNSAGANCGFSELTVSLNGATCSWGLPNFIDSYDYSNTIPNCKETEINNDIAKGAGISIFPNPFSVQTILHSLIPLEKATITVYNSFGEVVKQITNNSGQTITLNRDNLPSGLYFIRLTQNDKIISTNKLIIND